jgi:hypothetical protein
MTTPVRRFSTFAMIAVGVLIVAVAGPCTLLFVGQGLIGLAQGGDAAAYGGMFLSFALIGGGIPLAGGIVLLVVGVKTLRADRDQPPRPD